MEDSLGQDNELKTKHELLVIGHFSFPITLTSDPTSYPGKDRSIFHFSFFIFHFVLSVSPFLLCVLCVKGIAEKHTGKTLATETQRRGDERRREDEMKNEKWKMSRPTDFRFQQRGVSQ